MELSHIRCTVQIFHPPVSQLHIALFSVLQVRSLLSVWAQQLCAIKHSIGWDIRDSCHAQEHETRNALYILPAGLQQKKRTDDVALACSVNAAMSVKVVTLRAWPADWASHADSSTAGIFMVLSTAVGAADILPACLWLCLQTVYQ